MSAVLAMCPKCKREHREANPPRPITAHQLRVHALIERWMKRYRTPPTLDNLARELGLSKVTIFEHVHSLYARGLVVMSSGKAKRIVGVNPIPTGGVK